LSYSGAVKKGKKKMTVAPPVVKSVDPGGPKREDAAAKKRREELRRAKRRVPKSAAVVLHCPEGEYAAAARRARAAINLQEIGIEEINVRKALNGDLVIEIPGEDSETRAKILATRMEGVLRGTEAKVSCPTKTSEILLKGVDALVEADEVLAALREAAGLPLAGLKLGPLRPPYGGARNIWARLPAKEALLLVQKGKIRIGWATARVELLRGRPPRCYNCMGRGHVERACPLPAELRRCFICSSTAHFAEKCSAPPHCYLCSGAGRVGKTGVGHRPGSQECPPIYPRGRTKDKGWVHGTQGCGGFRPNTGPIGGWWGRTGPAHERGRVSPQNRG